MAKKNTPEKLPNLLEKIKECIEKGDYLFTAHALERQDERVIDTLTVLYILKKGYEEKPKTRFDPHYKTWKYAIRGKSMDEEDIRVIVAFDTAGMAIITVMYIC